LVSLNLSISSRIAGKVFDELGFHQSIGLTHRAEYKRARCIPTSARADARTYTDYARRRPRRRPLQADSKFHCRGRAVSHRDVTWWITARLRSPGRPFGWRLSRSRHRLLIISPERIITGNFLDLHSPASCYALYVPVASVQFCKMRARATCH
jgi:hypothetical protein